MVFLKNIQSALAKTFQFPDASKRILGLDMLRSLAILMVLLSHGFPLINHCIPGIYRVLLIDGVDLFFVLSGFLIGSIIIRQFVGFTHFTPALILGFWKRRWLRTLPNYYAILLVGLLPVLVLGPVLFNKPIYLKIDVWTKYIIFSQNLLTAHPTFFSVAWSLAVEEWFYLSLPLLLLFFRKIAGPSSPKQYPLMATIASVLLLGLAFRLYKFSQEGTLTLSDWDSQVRKVVVFRLDSLMFGVLGAYTKYYFEPLWKKYRHSSLVAGLLILSLLYQHNQSLTTGPVSLFTYAFLFTVNSGGILLILPFFDQLKSLRPTPGLNVIAKGITTFSIISYSLYLVHDFLILDKIKKVQPYLGVSYFQSTLVSLSIFSLYLVLSVAVSLGLYNWLEKPIMNRREKELLPQEEPALTMPQLIIQLSESENVTLEKAV
ncbi:acyltransferase family protein [Tellurirhabdus bombi]|uniref:acyltransferase family protein n=1 Tax=Tellurirhabdus bombi TaxID=2907205 RepID=UPI001F1B6242|nr:acyltransferase [Tellurirhabdus bombi]